MQYSAVTRSSSLHHGGKNGGRGGGRQGLRVGGRNGGRTAFVAMLLGSTPSLLTDGSTTKLDDVAAPDETVEDADAGDPAVGTANGVGLVMLKIPNGLSVKRLCPMSNGLKTRDRTFTVPRVVAGWS